MALYKDQHGRKKIGAGSDGTKQGGLDCRATAGEDDKQKKAWAEVSGAPEAIGRKPGVPFVPNHHAAKLTVKHVELDPDGQHYVRQIGPEFHRKAIIGHPKFD